MIAAALCDSSPVATPSFFTFGLLQKYALWRYQLGKLTGSSVSGHIWPSKTIFFFGSVEKSSFCWVWKAFVVVVGLPEPTDVLFSLSIVHTSNPALPLSLIHNNVKPVKAMFIIATVSSILLWVHQCPQFSTASTKMEAIVMLCAKIVTKLVA